MNSFSKSVVVIPVITNIIGIFGPLPLISCSLKSTLNGDNTAVYWALLNIKFAEAQRTALKAEASKAPKRVKRLSMVLLVCFMLIYVVVIGQTLLSSLGGLFG